MRKTIFTVTKPDYHYNSGSQPTPFNKIPSKSDIYSVFSMYIFKTIIDSNNYKQSIKVTAYKVK